MSRNLYYDTNRNDIFRKDAPIGSNASEEDVLINLGFRDPLTREIRIGSMPKNPDLDVVLDNGEVYHIPKGYHSGEGVVRIEPLSLGSLTQGSATAEDIAENKVAWVNGIRLVGTLKLNHNNMEANAKAEDLLSGKDMWVRGEHIYGKMVVHMRQDKTLPAGGYYVIPKGYHGGEAIVSAIPLADQTKGTATVNDIDIGKSAWVNGKLLVGERESLATTLSKATASIRDIRRSKKAYIASGLVDGDMDEYLNHPPTILKAGDGMNVPVGYHDGIWVIQADSLYNQTKATATENDIRETKTAWVDGQLITGKMAQEICPDSPGDADPIDIAYGKTAWVNGKCIVGISKYNSVSYYYNEDNIDDSTSPIVHTLPHHNWSSIDTIIVLMINKDTGAIDRKHVFHDVVSGSNVVKSDLAGNVELSVVSVLGSPKVTVTNFDSDNCYIDVTICGYTVINFNEKDGDDDGTE